MDALLIWYLAIAVGCAASVRHSTREAKSKTPHRTLSPWLANLIAYTEPIEGYQDPLFFNDTDKSHAAKQKH